jgi:hypothetical protein
VTRDEAIKVRDQLTGDDENAGRLIEVIQDPDAPDSFSVLAEAQDGVVHTLTSAAQARKLK